MFLANLANSLKNRNQPFYRSNKGRRGLKPRVWAMSIQEKLKHNFQFKLKPLLMRYKKEGTLRGSTEQIANLFSLLDDFGQ